MSILIKAVRIAGFRGLENLYNRKCWLAFILHVTKTTRIF